MADDSSISSDLFHGDDVNNLGSTEADEWQIQNPPADETQSAQDADQHRKIMDLCRACGKGDLGAIRQLLASPTGASEPEIKVNINDHDGNGNTPLHYAASNGHMNAFRYLVESCGADPSIRNADGDSLLHDVAWNGCMDMACYLIETCRVDANAVNNEGHSPLHRASMNGHMDIVRYLVESAHADASARNENGLTPLHHASLNGHVDIVKYLLGNCGADGAVLNSEGDAPIHLAALNGHLSTIECFADISADDGLPIYTMKGRNGASSLHYAAAKGHLAVARFLRDIDREFNISYQDDDGMTALHYSCMGGHLNLVKFLIEDCGADPTLQSHDGSTPHYFATCFCHLDVAAYLVSQCDVDISVAGSCSSEDLNDEDDLESLFIRRIRHKAKMQRLDISGASFSSSSYVVLEENDIISGRGASSRLRPGNKKYLQVLHACFDCHETLDAASRRCLCQDIVLSLQFDRSRFLTKVTGRGGGDHGDNMWQQTSFKKACDRVRVGFKTIRKMERGKPIGEAPCCACPESDRGRNADIERAAPVEEDVGVAEGLDQETIEILMDSFG
eukprot:CAMPEP_0119547624 /NCGR_PEP_ID=MMETSP1352-20130426/1689_1 /TAXON_ID=265584 /ORGANISM="Stauroneis constricta, Strain CCMP1120" /LENGTH=562 /DNA_ID=CAMNT_0007592581 /DNA_START=99 /DNA_END=1787 /DNA_ORIENTATION=-